MGQPTVIIVAGTAGTGKSTIGTAIQEHYGLHHYIEADDIHPQANVDKMAQGIPLTDADRWGWLAEISRQSTAKARESGEVVIASCSALKKVYRDAIQKESPSTNFIYVFLYMGFQALVERTENRKDHFMKSSMLESQFAILELPKSKEEPNALVLDVQGKSVEEVVKEAAAFVDSRDEIL